MERQYKISKKNAEGLMLVIFGSDGFVKRLVVEEGFGLDAWRELWNMPPLALGAIERMNATGTWKAVEVPISTEFKIFWDVYSYKVGNKKRAEAIWKKMNEADRVKALLAVPRYLAYLARRPQMDQAYAETWLAQERWEGFQD